MSPVVEQLLNPSDLFVNLVGGMVIEAAFFALLAWVVPPRSKKVYWATLMLVVAVFMFFKPIMSPEVRLPLSMSIHVVLPVLLLRGSLFRRIVVCVLGPIAQTVGELVAVLCWISLTGLGYVDNAVIMERLPVYLFVVIPVEIAATALAMGGVRLLARRFLPEKAPAAGADGKPLAPWVRKYVWFPVMQLSLISITVALAFDVMRWEGGAPVVIAALLVLCAVVDVLLFAQIGRSVAQAQEEARAEILEEHIAEYLRKSERSQALLAQTAHLRHDLRNHRMVVEELCERGDYARAAAYLDEFSARLADE